MRGGRLVLALPPTGNHYRQPILRRTARGTTAFGMCQTDEALYYKAQVARYTSGLPGYPSHDPVRLSVVIYTNHAGRDLDNCLKVLLDALQADQYGMGGLYLNDKQIVGYDQLELEYDYVTPRVVVVWRTGPTLAKGKRTRGRSTPALAPDQSIGYVTTWDTDLPTGTESNSAAQSIRAHHVPHG